MLRVHVFFLAYLFGASQVAQIEFASHDEAPLVGLVLLDENLENGVGPARVDVGLRLPCDPVFLASPEQNEAVLGVPDHVLALAFHENACELVLPDHEGLGTLPVLEQVVQLLVVDL